MPTGSTFNYNGLMFATNNNQNAYSGWDFEQDATGAIRFSSFLNRWSYDQGLANGGFLKYNSVNNSVDLVTYSRWTNGVLDLTGYNAHATDFFDFKFTPIYDVSANTSAVTASRMILEAGKTYIICLKENVNKVVAFNAIGQKATIEDYVSGKANQQFTLQSWFNNTEDFVNFKDLANTLSWENSGNTGPSTTNNAWQGWDLQLDATGGVRFCHFLERWGWAATFGIDGTFLRVSDDKTTVDPVFYNKSLDGGATRDYTAYNAKAGMYYDFMIKTPDDYVSIKSVTNNSTITSLSTNTNCDITVSGAGTTLTIDANRTVKTITVAPGAKVTVNDGVSLNATNGITLQNTAGGTASFVDSRTADNPTAIAGTVEQAITETNRNWYVGVPVSGKLASDITLSGAKIVQRNEALSRWDDVLSGTTLTPGVGYIAVASATSGTTSWSLNGNLNSGKVEVGVTRSGASSTGFNLLGNPYPSYLNWEQVLNLNATNASLLQSSIWYRTKSGASYAFQTYNSAGRVATPTSTTGYIPPMQAFWVRANGAGTVTFTNAMRSHGDGASNKLKAPSVNTQKIIRIQVSNTAVTDEAVVYIDHNAQKAFDKYDTEKMFNNVASQPELYTKAGTEKLVINGLNEINHNQEIPLGLTYSQGGELKLKLTELSNFEGNNKVYLRDKQENFETELTPETEYVFSTTATTNNETRFSLVFKAPNLSTGTTAGNNEQISVFVNSQNQITIIADPNSNYSIFNAMGQLIEYGIINTKHELKRIKHEAGVYIVKVNNQSTKVILR